MEGLIGTAALLRCLGGALAVASKRNPGGGALAGGGAPALAAASLCMARRSSLSLLMTSGSLSVRGGCHGVLGAAAAVGLPEDDAALEVAAGPSSDSKSSSISILKVLPSSVCQVKAWAWA